MPNKRPFANKRPTPFSSKNTNFDTRKTELKVQFICYDI